jgi:hypothetical protein
LKSFWAEFFSGNNAKINSMAVISLLIAAPVVLLASAALIYHIFLLHKGLDSPSVQLLVAMLTAATGGLGASMFSRSTLSVVSRYQEENIPQPPSGPVGRAKPKPEGR